MAKVILLPELPPPLSACYRNARGPGRVKTERYKAWIELCGWALATDKKDITHGEVRVEYAYQRPKGKRRRDLANLEKATSDLITALGYIDDDSMIMDMRLYWADDIPAPVEIRIWRI